MISESEYNLMKIDDENSIAVIPKTGFWMAMNPSAVNIFKLYLNGKGKREIVSWLSDYYGLPQGLLEKDVQFCISTIQKRINEHDEAIRNFFESEQHNRQLTIHITDACNLCCPYCFKSATKDSSKKDCLSSDLLFETITIAAEYGFREIVFSGGEPTIRADFEEILDKLDKLRPAIKFSIVTNGTIPLSDDTIRKMCSFFSSMQISIDSYSEEKNAKTRGIGSLEKVNYFVEKLKSNQYTNFYYACTPYTNDMSYPSTIEDLPMMLRYAANTGSSGLYVNHLKPDGRMKLNEYNRFNEESFWKNADLMYEEFGILYKSGFNKKDMGKDFQCSVASDYTQITGQNNYSPNCGLGINELTIDCNGNVYPCSALIFDKFKQGNVLDEYFGDIIIRAREKFKNITVDSIKKCKDCELRMICGGGCRAMAFFINGDIDTCDPNCTSCKRRIYKWMNVSLIMAANNSNTRWKGDTIERK